ncbi:MAG: PQQ-dependent sugar dehydrogenase [Thermoanaerobaculaceae bacterium]|nr:PQQ-dependent sugar dehydrogenase [Thermoanaerobaculaceae bacterium]
MRVTLPSWLTAPLLAALALALPAVASGGTSLRFFGNGTNDIDRVKIPIDDPATSLPGPPADVGATDFTIEFWLKGAAADNTAAAVSCGANVNWIYGNIVLDRDRYNQDRKFGLSLAAGRVVFGVSGDGTGDLTICGVTPVLDERWHHVAVQRRRADGYLWLFVDGVLEAQGDGPDGDVSYPDDGVPGNYCGGPCTGSDPFLVLAAEKHDAGPSYPSFNGYLDELRLSTTLRYTSGFTRPAQPFIPDAATAALYHFDEGSGTTLGDSSGAAGGPSNGQLRVGGSPTGPVWSSQEPPFGGYLTLTLTPIASGLPRITSITSDGPGRLFITLQTGQVRIVDNGTLLPTPFLDLSSLVSCCGERGLLSLAFDPGYATNGAFYVHYTDTSGNSVVARYAVSANPNLANPTSGVTLLTVTQPYANHNGGPLAFGRDGYLYVALGDGGSGGDPDNRAQNLGELLGKLLRLDVSGAPPYQVPATNPFVGITGAREEIWALGLRNPWKVAFDRRSGDVFIGDVGQGTWEEIDFQPAGSSGGENYGWRLKEGDHCYNPPSSCDPGGLADPILEYPHTEGNCSVTGGTRYRGGMSPRLDGVYLYGDYCSGRIWGASQRGDGSWRTVELVDTTMNISTFGEDAAGEVYVASYSSSGGTVYRIDAAPVPNCTATDVSSFTAPATATYGIPYQLHWSAVGPATTFELAESTSPTFSPATTQLVTGTSFTVIHTGSTPQTYYTRLRPLDTCGAVTFSGPWTPTQATAVASNPACQIEIANQVYAAAATVTSCGTLALGPNVQVQAAGVVFRAAYQVTLRNGFSVLSGASAALGLDPSLANP